MVNGFHLPGAFVQLCEVLREGGWSHFTLKEPVDAYGNHFDHPIEEIWCDRLEERTIEIARDFSQSPDADLTPERKQELDDYFLENYPGSIPSIRD